MSLHPIFRDLLAAHQAPQTHRGWIIAFEEQPDCCWAYQWTARHPLFDGFEADDRIVHGPSREAVIARVDAWLAEEVEL